MTIRGKLNPSVVRSIPDLVAEFDAKLHKRRIASGGMCCLRRAFVDMGYFGDMRDVLITRIAGGRSTSRVITPGLAPNLDVAD